MENKINVAEILKDCPTGMELDCTMYEDVYFDFVDELNIIHCYIHHGTHKTSITFNQHGTPNSDIKSKCVIFPKGKTTWEGFVLPYKFNDGDILYIRTSNQWICIYKEGGEKENVCHRYLAATSLIFVHDDSPLCHRNNIKEIRLATEEEKQKLFKAIKDNGYKWNARTKTLEKLIEPKFKVGDRIKTVYNPYQYVIKEITDTHYTLVEVEYKYRYTEPINEDENWELVPDKFDISTLKPFDKVLCRQDEHSPWIHSFFGIYSAEATKNPFICSNGFAYKYCIPYEENKHLLSKTYDCDEYYKIWE